MAGDPCDLRAMRWWLPVFSTLLFVIHSAGQEAPRFTRIPWNEQASLEFTTAIARDSLGFLWLGTNDGIARFDGSDLTAFRYSRSDSTSLPGGVTWSIVPDRDGQLWVGSDGGLCRFDPRSGRCARYAGRGPHGAVVAMDPQGTLWAGTGNGLARYDRMRDAFISVLGTDRVGTAITDLFAARDGSLWIGTLAGLLHFDPGTRQLERIGAPKDDLRTSNVQDIAEDAQGRIWCAFWGGGIARWDADAHRFIAHLKEPHAPNPSIANIFYAILPVELNGRTSILAASAYGLMIADEGAGDSLLTNIQSISDEESLPCGTPHALFAEVNGQLWVGGERGLCVAVPAHQAFIRLARVGAGNIERLRAEGDALQVCTWYGKGLVRIDAQGRSHVWPLPSNAPEGREHMSDAVRLADGRLLIATFNGLLRLDTMTGHYAPVVLSPGDDPLPDVRCMALCRENDDLIWVGTYNGWVYRYHPVSNAFDRSGREAGIASRVSAIACDRRGIIWIGDAEGLLHVEPGSGRFNREGEALIGGRRITIPEVTDLVVDDRDRLWVATTDGLFLRDTTGVFTLFGIENGLPQREVTCVEVDAAGNAWAVTPGGLTRIANDGAMENITLHESMPARRISDLARLSDGSLVFALGSELFRFDPDRSMGQADVPSHVVITGFKVNGSIQPMPAPAIPIDLDHDQDQLAFTFVAPHYPDRGTRYRYMLEGADRSWNESGSVRTANYAGLPPGNYTFRVQAIGRNASPEATLHLSIHPPFWRTAWFIALSTLIMLALVVVIVRREARRKLNERILVLEKQQAVEAERRRISRDMHDDLGSGLTRIAILGEVARSKALGAGVSDRIEAMAGSARELVDNLNDIVWALNPGHDLLPSLAAYLREYAGKLLEPAGIALSSNFPDVIPDRAVPETFRRNVFLIIKEALNNVIKHASATTVELSLKVTDAELKIIVRDNGKGLTADRTFGNGLRNMRERAASINGQLEVGPDTTGAGTRVTLHVPLPK